MPCSPGSPSRPTARTRSRPASAVRALPVRSAVRFCGAGADLIVIERSDQWPRRGALGGRTPPRHRVLRCDAVLAAERSGINGAIIIVMQRLHQDDLVGHVLDKEPWEVLSIPAIAMEDATYRIGERPGAVYRRRAGEVLHPGREPIAWLDAPSAIWGRSTSRPSTSKTPCRRRAMRSSAAGSGPMTEACGLRSGGGFLGHRFDPGRTSDWSVGTVWGAQGQHYYLLDVIRVVGKPRAAAPDDRCCPNNTRSMRP